MTPEQVREIVKITIEELTNKRLIRTDSYQSALKVVERQLRGFFSNKDNSQIGRILRQLSDDTYIDIIFLHYRDAKTLEWVAEYYNVDVSTIKRNKKRLILKIYELLEEL